MNLAKMKALAEAYQVSKLLAVFEPEDILALIKIAEAAKELTHESYCGLGFRRECTCQLSDVFKAIENLEQA